MSVTNKQIADAFRHAKALLGNTGQRSAFICICLESAFTACKINKETWQRAARIIHKSLGRHYVLEHWIKHSYPELENKIDKDWSSGGHRMLATRMAWLDSLISEFDSK